MSIVITFYLSPSLLHRKVYCYRKMNQKIFILGGLGGRILNRFMDIRPDVILLGLLKAEPQTHLSQSFTMGTFVLKAFLTCASRRVLVRSCDLCQLTNHETVTTPTALPLGPYCKLCPWLWHLVHLPAIELMLFSYDRCYSVSGCERADSVRELSLSFPCNHPLCFWVPCQPDRLRAVHCPLSSQLRDC